MGKAQSKPSRADTNSDLQAELVSLQKQLSDVQLKAQEHQNLLRYKIEVLVNMLATEEKRAEITETRLETLKALVASKGIDSQSLTSSASKETIFDIDVDGAIQRMSKQFSIYRVEIVQAFADDDGKIITTLSYDDFIKQLYSLTDEEISKTDLQVIAIRFGNGYGTVSIPEFLEYFSVSPQVRIAKASTAAVRMSLDLLQLEMGMEENASEPIDDKNNSLNIPNNNGTHEMNKLDIGARRLILMWNTVEEPLRKSFSEVSESNSFDTDGQIISINEFKKTLHSICGDSSPLLKASTSSEGEPLEQPSHIALSEGDVELIATRFEIGNFVHVGLFFQYFNELKRIQEYFSIKRGLSVASSVEMLSVSPFRVASEWRQLRERSIFTQNKTFTEKVIRKSLLPPKAPVTGTVTAPKPPTSDILLPSDQLEVKEGQHIEKTVIAPEENKDALVDQQKESNGFNAQNDKSLDKEKNAISGEKENSDSVAPGKEKAESKNDEKVESKPTLEVDPPPKASFMDFFRCGGKGKAAARKDAPADLPAPKPAEGTALEAKRDTRAEEKDGDAKAATPDEKKQNDSLSIEVPVSDGHPELTALKLDEKFATPPKATSLAAGKTRSPLDAESKKPSFSRPRQGQVNTPSPADTPIPMNDSNSENDGYSSQASDISRTRQLQQQRQNTKGKSATSSRFRKIPQKGFEVEDFADDSGSNGNDSFYRQKPQDLPPQDNVMTRPFARRNSGSESEEKDKDNRVVNFSPSTRGQ